MSFTLVPEIVPSGGAILVEILSQAGAGNGGLSLDRSQDGGTTWTNLYSGAFIERFLDVGDKLPQALDTATTYLYRVSDTTTPSISALSAGVIPVCQLTLLTDMTTETWRRLIQSSVNSLAVPPGYAKPQVLFAMPLDSTPKLPFIVMNLDLLQQEEVPIGFSIPMEQSFVESLGVSGAGVWTIQGLQNRRYSIHVLTKTFEERDFYESAIVGIIYGLQSTLSALFQQVRFSYQVTQGAIESDASQPGFYYSQIGMNLSSIGMVSLSAQTGVFSGIGVTALSAGHTASATISGSGLFVET